MSDDWSIDVTLPERVLVPSFIRLFVIRRILNKHGHNVDDLVKEIANLKNRQIAHRILSGLVKDGIKKFMKILAIKTPKQQQSEIQIIEMIFSSIILKHFDNEYQNVIKYPFINTPYNNNIAIANKIDKDNADFHFQNIVFNTDDLMCSIFQFIEYQFNNTGLKGDLFNCNLVCSHWLYHVWNPNSICSVDFGPLLKHEDNITQMQWQRFINAKDVKIRSNVAIKLDDYLLGNIGMFKNIIKLYISIVEECMPLLKIIIQNCKENIEWCFISVQSKSKSNIDTVKMNNKKNRISPLKLMNTKYIFVQNLYFYIEWSNKCEKLVLNQSNSDSLWCNFIIKKCDCTGIKSLTLSDELSFSLNIKDNLNEKLLQTFANIFTNLKYLEINRFSEKDYQRLLLFWKYLFCIINKNNGTIKLNTYSRWDGCQKFNKMIKETKTTINQIKILIFQRQRFNHMHEMILNSNVEYLTFDNLEDSDVVLSEIVTFLDIKNVSTKKNDNNNNNNNNNKESEFKLGGLQMIRCEALCITLISAINDLFKLDLIVKRHVFGMFIFEIAIPDEIKFDILCQSIFLLLMTHKSPINITLKFQQMRQDMFKTKYEPVFLSHFDINNKEIFEQYKPPIIKQANKYCQSLMHPNINFTRDSEKNIAVLHVCNVKYVERHKLF